MNRVVAVMLLLTYIVITSSHYAYSQVYSHILSLSCCTCWEAADRDFVSRLSPTDPAQAAPQVGVLLSGYFGQVSNLFRVSRLVKEAELVEEATRLAKLAAAARNTEETARAAGNAEKAARAARNAKEAARASRNAKEATRLARLAEDVSEAKGAAKVARNAEETARAAGNAEEAARDAEVARGLEEAAGNAEKAAMAAEALHYDLLRSRVINRIVDLIGGRDVLLVPILEDIGYSPIALNSGMWKAFPAVRKLETAYRAAEKANPGGGIDLLVHVVHKLANRYETIGSDHTLKGLVALQPSQSIKFAEIELSPPPTVPLPRKIAEIINAIVRWCDGCEMLGGMRGVLENYLGATDAFDILRSSKSNAEAIARAASGLELQDAIARFKEMIGYLQRYYESARHNNEFNEFMDVRFYFIK